MPPITYLGYTPGLGAGETHNTPDLTGFQTAYHNIGPGSTAAANGSPFAMVTKVFDPGNGYPNFPTSWGGNAQTFAANNGGHALLPIIVWGSAPVLAIPSTAQIVTFLQSLPAGQPCAFQYVSEVEGGKDFLIAQAGTYVGNVKQFSANLNAALAQMISAGGSASFWTRTNFPYVMSSRMSYYASGGDTAYLAPPTAVDVYGADFYQNVGPGTSQNVGAQADNRFQNWLKQVKNVAGANPRLGCPEYGIRTVSFSTLTSAQQQATEAQRAALLAKDYAYFTGTSRPGGTSAFALLNYWYQMPGSGSNGCFPLCDGSETKTQALATIQQWQQMVADSQGGPPPQTTITVTNPGTQNNVVGQAASVQIQAVDSNPALALSYSATGLPAGAKIDAASGLITGTLTTSGSFNVVVTVADGTGTTASTSFGWVVNPSTVPTVTVVNPGTQTSTAHLTITPLQIGATDSAGNALTYSATGLPTGLSIAPASGLISGTPTAPGSFTVVVTATDSVASVSGNTTFTWNIAASVVTVASPGNQSSITNEVITPLQIGAADSAGAGISFSATGLPTGLSISSAGLITGTTTAPGTFSVVVTGTDSFGSTGQTSFTWTVGAVTVTVTNPGPLTNNLGDTVSFPIVANDSAGLALTYSAGGTLPPGLAIAAATGLITGQPTTAGTYRVTITATDTTPVAGAASFTWTITDVAQLLAISFAPVAGQDIFGNAYAAGIVVGLPTGPQTTIGMDGTLHYQAPVQSMPAMINGWNFTNGHAKYVLDVLGNLVVSWKNLSPGTDTDGTVIWPTGSLPQAYRPANNRRVHCYTDQLRVIAAGPPTTTEGAALEIQADGSVQCYGIAAAATRVDLFAVIPLSF